MSIETVYSDFSFSLDKNQYSDFELITNLDAIYQSMKTILFTKIGNKTKFQNPYFGSILHKLLFEKMSIFTNIQIQDEITTALDIWEPRIKVNDVEINANYETNTYSINILFHVIDINIEDNLVLELDISK